MNGQDPTACSSSSRIGEGSVTIETHLLRDLEELDRTRTSGTSSEDRTVARIMRRAGFSETDIEGLLGVPGQEEAAQAMRDVAVFQGLQRPRNG